MTTAEKLKILKSIIGISLDNVSDDDALIVYLDISKQKILCRAFPYANETEIPTKYELLQCEIAAYLWNKRGAEGQSAHSENGINRSYESADVPESMFRQIVPYIGTL